MRLTVSPEVRNSRVVKAHRSFDPRRVGSLECDAWVAYYRRRWLPFLRAAILLTRHTFALPWPQTARGAWLVLLANFGEQPASLPQPAAGRLLYASAAPPSSSVAPVSAAFFVEPVPG